MVGQGQRLIQRDPQVTQALKKKLGLGDGGQSIQGLRQFVQGHLLVQAVDGDGAQLAGDTQCLVPGRIFAGKVPALGA